MNNPWCRCHLPLDGVELWLQEAGSAVLQLSVTCELCHRPRLGLLPQGHGGYSISPGPHPFLGWCSLESANFDRWLQETITNRWMISQILENPFRALSFWVQPTTMQVTCATTEIYSEFEAALAVGRKRQELYVFDFASRKSIVIS